MNQIPILTVTLNPTLDMSTDADEVLPELKIRCDAPTLDPGGGGTNVARAVNILGGRATAWVALAGFRGQQVAALLGRENVPHILHEMAGETRLSLAVGNRAAGNQYRFVMPGPTWSDADAEQALTHIEQATEEMRERAGNGPLLVLSGSMPPGVGGAFVSDLAKRTGPRGAQLILDTSGTALKTVAETRDAGLKVLRLDQAESEDLAGHPLPGAADGATFARRLVHAGTAECVVMGRGADGSILVTNEGAWQARGPVVPVRSKVGAGDSFLAAFTLALANAAPPEQALCHGVAAASAAVMSAATSLCAREDFERLLPDVTLLPL